MPSRPSLLIADDQPDLRMLLRLTFEGAGYALREAADGDTALAACKQQAPDVALLDVMMPGLDGYELCRAIKGDPRLRGTMVVLMTAGDQAIEREKARVAGADLYVAKPFSPSQLLRQVEALFASRRP